MSEDLGVWCHKCGSTSVKVIDGSGRMEAYVRLRHCESCGARMIFGDKFIGFTRRLRIRGAFPPEVPAAAKKGLLPTRFRKPLR